MTKELIESIRQTLIPFVKKELLKINYEDLGKSDAEEFEKDLNEVLDLAIKALEQQTSEDCVSRQAAIDYLYTNMAWYNENGSIADDSQKLRDITNLVNGIPPVTPTHGTCKECKYSSVHTISLDKIDEIRVCRIQFSKQIKDDYYCANFEKRSSEDD